MKSQHGFTLLELAIVLVVLTVLAAGLLVPLSTSIETRRVRTAQEDMAKIQDALVGYAMSHTTDPTNGACECTYSPNPVAGNPPQVTANPQACLSLCPVSTTNTDTLNGILTLPIRHYLPCPNYDGTGIEDRDPTTHKCKTFPSNLTPLLPWATLGLPATDPWGNAYGYDVYYAYADGTIGFGPGNPPDTGDQTCPTTAGDNYPRIYRSCVTAGALLADHLAAVVISFGPNGLGAYSPANHPPVAGTLYTANVASSNADENINGLSGTPASAGQNSTAYHNYVSQPPSTSGGFDDIVQGLSFPLLLNRVCPSGAC
jgi:prepilin-type N-terminal cleavage/methylation domain-containing protein